MLEKAVSSLALSNISAVHIRMMLKANCIQRCNIRAFFSDKAA